MNKCAPYRGYIFYTYLCTQFLIRSKLKNVRVSVSIERGAVFRFGSEMPRPRAQEFEESRIHKNYTVQTRLVRLILQAWLNVHIKQTLARPY